MSYDRLHRRFGFFLEVEAETGALFFVVGEGLPKFRFRFLKDEGAGHGPVPARFVSIDPNT